MIYATWPIKTVVAANDFVEPKSSLYFGFQCTTGGLTGVSEPDWVTGVTDGSTVTDGAATWTARQSQLIVWLREERYQTGVGEPVWPTTIGTTVADGSGDNPITWTCRTPAITDASCPQSTLAIAMSSKIFSPYQDVLRYCATNAPRDWSSESDAGFLPIGQTATQTHDVTALGGYRGKLVVMTASNTQLWTTDPDPTQMSLFDTKDGIGTPFKHANVSIADDMFFLTRAGVRSLSIAAGAENTAAGDVGSPVDTLAQAKIVANAYDPMGFYYPGHGQFWEAWGNDLLVYTNNKLGKPGGWSRYTFNVGSGYTLAAVTQMDSRLFLRFDHASNVSKCYEVDPDAISDGGTSFFARITWNFLDLGEPGVTKQLFTIDLVGAGQPSLLIYYDQTNPAQVTDYFLMPVSDSLPNNPVPFPIAAPSMKFDLYYADMPMRLDYMLLSVQDVKLGP